MTLAQMESRAIANRTYDRQLEARGGVAQRVQDEEAFAALFLEHYTSLCAFVDSYLQAPDVAEEVVQTVFLRLWENRDSRPLTKGARAYLFAACRNLALDLLRHERIVKTSAPLASRTEVNRSNTAPPADAAVEAAELAARLRQAVAELPERRRLVVTLRWQHQFTNQEIAEIMGISTKGVEMQFSRALADLRRALGPAVRELM